MFSLLSIPRCHRVNMDQKDDGLNNFLTYWFAGFSSGIDSLDANSRQKILAECGKSCARSYTTTIFKNARQNSSDLKELLKRLHEYLPNGRFELLESGSIRATYLCCDCDLVRLGLVGSPNLCECSAANFAENLKSALEVPVSVEIEKSILRGADCCVLTASFDEKSITF